MCGSASSVLIVIAPIAGQGMYEAVATVLLGTVWFVCNTMDGLQMMTGQEVMNCSPKCVRPVVNKAKPYLLFQPSLLLLC